MKTKVNDMLSAATMVSAGIILVAAFAIVALLALPQSVYAQDLGKAARCGSNLSLDRSNCDLGTDAEVAEARRACAAEGGSASECAEITKSNLGSNKIEGLIKTVLFVFSAIVGAIAVIMIIVGGFKYIISAGDANKVSSAKNTIIYAIVGLVIVVLAQIIVRFVLEKTT